MQSLNYPELYKSLTKNLSSKSIKCVDNIISKIKLVSENNIIVHDILFSKQEQKQIKKVLLDLFFNIKKINDNCYRYKKYKLPINHFEGSVFYYKHNVDSLNKMLFNNKDIIDVGGYIGDSAIVFSPYTNGMIYSFEPTTGLYNFMQQTLKLNQKCKNIVPINIGLGSKKEKQLIHLMDSGSSINRLIVLNEYETEEIEITTLDDYVKENNLNNIGLIKVDIEGFEQEFLKGAINTIITQKPTLLLSIYHFATDFFNIKSIIEKLNLGYKYRIVKPLDGTIRGEILLICEQ
ncbi:FkbM family methyltransferase [bacterium]|nr:FkbM family methyltransferase [bacterium]